MIRGIDHIQIAIPAGGEAAARRFYAGLLGFLEEPKPAVLAGRGGAWFRCGEVRLHLGVDAEFRPARKAHPAFRVDDLEALLAGAQAAGFQADLSQPPLDGFRRAHLFDPFGNRIELMQAVPQREAESRGGAA